MERALAAIVGDEWVQEPPASVAELEGVRPRFVVSPGSPAEVAEVLRLASAERWAVLPTGSGCLLGLGNPPRAGDLWLSTRRLAAITEYEPADLTAAVQGGCTLGALNGHLAGHHQVLPWDPPGGAARTVGGIAATGRVGPLRLGFGQPRDWVIGIEAATVEGKLIRAGGRVVKNVAGYDLTRLFVGSLGTLGVITQLNVRVRPQPATELTGVITGPDRAGLWALARAAIESYVMPVAMELLSPEAARACGFDPFGRDDMLCVRVAGEEADVRDQILRLEKLAADRNLDMADQVPRDDVGRFWTAVADLPLSAGAQVALRLSVPPSRLEATAAVTVGALAQLMEEAAWAASPPLGTLWVLLGGPLGDRRVEELATKVAQVRAACVADGGSLVVARAPLALKRQLDVWGPAGTSERLMRAMKRVFDPDGLLNPGRFVAGL